MASQLTKTKHPHLFRDEKSGVFYYRRYSSRKRKQYFKTTGERDNAARAYKIGLQAYNDWIGRIGDEQGEIYFDQYAEKFLERRVENPGIRDRTKKLAEYEIARLVDGLGHLRLDQITAERYEEWVKDSRRISKRQKFANAKKVLVQILRDAHGAGYMERVPRLPSLDAPAEGPQYLRRDVIRRILKHCRSKSVKLLAFIMWKQGARPGEILQYEWSMIRWDEGEHGHIHIPGRITKTKRSRAIPLNSRVSRVLMRLYRSKNRAPTEFIFPSHKNPGQPQGQYTKTWDAACASAKIPHVTIYALRDTFVTDKLKKGVSLAFVAKYIDSSPKMLAERYAVAEEEAMRGVAE